MKDSFETLYNDLESLSERSYNLLVTNMKKLNTLHGTDEIGYLDENTGKNISVKYIENSDDIEINHEGVDLDIYIILALIRTTEEQLKK